MKTDCMYYPLNAKKSRNEYLEKHLLSINVTCVTSQKETVLFKNRGGSGITVQTISM